MTVRILLAAACIGASPLILAGPARAQALPPEPDTLEPAQRQALPR